MRSRLNTTARARREQASRDNEVHETVVEDQRADAGLSDGRHVKFEPRKTEYDKVETHRIDEHCRDDIGVGFRDDASALWAPRSLELDT